MQLKGTNFEQNFESDWPEIPPDMSRSTRNGRLARYLESIGLFVERVPVEISDDLRAQGVTPRIDYLRVSVGLPGNFC